MRLSVHVTCAQQTTGVTKGFCVAHKTIVWMLLLTYQQLDSQEMKTKLKGRPGKPAAGLKAGALLAAFLGSGLGSAARAAPNCPEPPPGPSPDAAIEYWPEPKADAGVMPDCPTGYWPIWVAGAGFADLAAAARLGSDG